MVRASVIVSALFAITSVVYANPAGTLINIDGGDHIGLGTINAQGLGNEAVDARGVVVKDLIQDVDILHDDDDAGFDGGFDSPAPATRPARPVRPVRPTRPTRAETHVHSGGCHHDHGLLGNLLKREETVAADNAVKMAGAHPKGSMNHKGHRRGRREARRE